MWPLTCELADPEQIQRWVAHAGDTPGSIDMLVNHASGYGHGDDDARSQTRFDIDLMAAVRCNRAALPRRRGSGRTCILNISAACPGVDDRP